MSMFAHPIPAEWLTAYHDGELDARRRAQVEAHLPECAECRRELEELKTLGQALASVELPQGAMSGAEVFWRSVQTQLPERGPVLPAETSWARAGMRAGTPVSAGRLLLRWLPGIVLLLVNGAVQVAAVAGAGLLLTTAWLWRAPAWATSLAQLATGATLGLPTWLLPANWGGWELLGFWLVVSAELAVLYLAWLGYELRYGPFATNGGAVAA